MNDNRDLDSLKIVVDEDIKNDKNSFKKKKQEEKKKEFFNKKYIPVVGLSILLLFLIISLGIVFTYEKKDYNIDVPEEEVEVVDKVVDTSNSLCSKKEVNNLYQTANKVGITYNTVKKVVSKGIDMQTGKEVDVLGYVQKVDITNVTDDIYIVVNNDNATSKQKNLKLSAKDAKDGVITYFTEYTNDVVKYSMKIYSSTGDCANELFREFEFVTPIYNRYYDMDICENYREFKYCQKFITEDRPTQQEFQVALAAYQKENKVTTSNDGTILDSELKEHQDDIGKEDKDSKLLIMLIIGVVVLLVTVGIIAVILLKKKKGVK